MPLENPIIEVLKPALKAPRFLDTPVPENIKPILELLGARAVAFRTEDVDHWEITTQDGQHYIRVEQAFVEDNEDTWRELIGHLLDYAKSKEVS
jgi:hypothetical protein